MAGQATIGVSLQFNADVNAAKQNIQSLQQTLASLSKINIGNGLNLDKDFLSAKQSAIELKNILNQTFNQQTGKLDLRAFNSSIQASGKSLTEYRQQLGLLGADGDKAFRQVANAVMSAEVPLLKTNKLAASLWDSLKRTAKWQLSSSIIHGFMGAIQKAYGYAQDLNESLNNIRIVTGYNTDKMAGFAKEANAAAQALSTTTTAYTDASLIYFQQGLNDAQVKERAAVTINMANVTRQSAEIVSDQMTAIWNNFAKGGENLESYADKMVALGAATASSSDEIAQGLEKFAAIADTVGLSFDYAAAALATVTAETRQSADTVGTAFKTLFARLESLSLGDTLEDGTDLTKYSKALQAVGINVKDASGELKKMDIILEELGAKWQTLAKDQQVALAQTVAGQRQYNNLIALMSNWDKFQENLTTARNSEGALQEQADIYAESWEAAQKRVQAALEEIYDKLISSDGFINLLNGAEKFINLISKIIDGLGGLQGVLSLVGVIVTKVFSNELIAGVDNLILRFKDFSGQTAAEMAALKTEASVVLDEMKGNEASGILLERNLNLQKTAINLGDKLTQTDLLRIQNQIAFNNELYNAAVAMENEIKKGKELISVLQEQLQVADLVRDSVVPAQTSAANIRQAANYSLQTANSTDFTYDTPEGVAAINNFSNNFNAMDASAISDKAAAAAEAWGQAEAKLNEFMEKQQQGVEIAESSVNAVQAKIIEAIKTILEEANRLKIKDADGNILSPTNTEELTKRTSQLEENFKQLAIHKKELGKIKTDSTDIKDITKEAEKLQKIMQQMSKEKGMPTFSDKEIKSSVNSAEDLEKKLKMVNDRLKERESYMNKGDGLGVSPEEIAKMQQMGEQTANVAEATENLGNVIEMPKEAYDQLLNSLDQTAVSFGKVVNMASQYGMSIGMASSAMSGLVSSIADGNFGFQNLTSLVMTASMAIRTWNQGIELGKKIQETSNTIKEISIALDKKELSAEQAKDIQTKISKSNILQLIFAKKAKKLATIEETVATEADTVATDVNADAVRAHPVLGPLLAILGLVVIAISAVTTAIDKNTQKIHENAEEAAQKAEETRKEVKALNEQKQAYDEVYNRFKQGIATKDEYTEVTASLAEALGIENAAILIEQGRYEELNRLIDEYLKKKKIEAADAARESVKNRQKDTKTQAEEIGLKTYSQGKGTLFNSAMLPGNGDISWNNFDTTNFKSVQKTGNTIGVKAIDLKDEDAVQSTINELKSAMEYAKNQGASDEYIQKFKDEIKHLEEWERKYFDANLDDFKTIVEGLEVSGDIKTDFSDLNFDNYGGKIEEVAQTILDENLPGMTEEIANQLAQELVSEKDADLAKKIDLVDRLFKISPEQTQLIKDQIHDFVKSLEDDTTINYLLSLPKEELKEVAEDLDHFKDKYGNQVIKFKAETDFNFIFKGVAQINSLEMGKSYKESELNDVASALKTAGINADLFFTKMADGSYMANSSLTELKLTLEQIKIDKAKELIEATGAVYEETREKALKLKEEINNFKINIDETEEQGQNRLENLKTEFEQVNGELTDLVTKTKELSTELADSANSFDELDRYKKEKLISDDDYSYNYNRLRESYLANTVDSEKLESYTRALLNMDEALAESEQKFHGNIAAAEAYARSCLRMNQGVEKLAKGIEDWSDILLKSKDVMSEEYITALNDTTDAMADLLDMIPHDIPDGFVNTAENIELLKKAATGSEAAIDELRSKLNDAVILDIVVKNELEDKKDDILTAHQNLKNLLENNTIAPGVVLDTRQFVDAANQLIKDADMTSAQVQAYFDSIGFQAEMDYTTLQMPQSVPETIITPKVDFSKFSWGDAIKGAFGLGESVVNLPTISFQSFTKQAPAGEIDTTIASIGSTKTIQKPVVKSLTKKATGINNNYSSKNAGGGAPSTGKSSSGSKGSTKEKTPKKASDEIDRYHEIDSQIGSLSKKLNELATLKDRAWGGRHIAAIRAEQAALEEYGNLLSQKLAEAEAYLQKDAALINAYGAQYDEYGHITNYNQILTNAVNAYNSGSIEEEEYNDIKKKLANYEDSLKTREDLLYEQAENARKILDSKFEEVEYTVEINLEIDDRKIKYLEWLMDHLENKPFSEAEIISTASQNFDNMVGKWEDYAKGIHDILTAAGASESAIAAYINGNADAIASLDNLTEQAVEDLGEYTDGLMDTYDQLVELKKLVESQLSKIWDEWNDKIQTSLDLMNHYDSILTHYQNIIDIIGADPLGLTTANLLELSRAQVEASKNITEAYKADMEAKQQQLATARSELAKVSAEEDVKYWEDEIQRLQKELANAEEDYYSSWEETLKRAADLYDLTLKQAIKDFESSFSSAFKSFEEAQELLDQQKTLAAQYVPEYKKLYELGKLNRELNKSLEKTNTISAQNKLKDLQDEINDKMREGVQLSEYDLEYLQKKYDLRLAEIALEEAQDAKNVVRLRRDATGNYGYVYTADESKTNDAIQDYEDKLYNIQELTENYLNELSEAYVATMKEMTEAIAAIRREDYASEEEYEAKIEQVKNYYTARLQYYTDEINKALHNNQQLYLEDKNYTDKIFSDKEKRQRDFTTDFKQTLVGGVLQGFNSINEATETLVSHLGGPDDPQSLIGTLCTNYNNWKTVTDTVLKLNGTSFTNFQTHLENVINGENGINKKIRGMREEVTEMAKKAVEDYNNTANAIADFQARTSPKLKQLFDETEAYTEAHLKLLAALETHIEDPQNTVTTTYITRHVDEGDYGGGGSDDGGSSGDSGGGYGGGYGSNPQGTGSTTKSYHGKYTVYVGTTPFTVDNVYNVTSQQEAQNQAKIDAYAKARRALSSYTSSPDNYISNQSGLAVRVYKYNGQYFLIKGSAGSPGGTYVKTFNTGGYTGAWGTEGRLAMLHEKELVLNKTDTKNMLSAVETIRKVSQTIDLQASAEKGNLINRTKNINTNAINNMTGNAVEQTVTIQADFPAATDRNEIAEAFNQLMQQSLQHVYRYNE